MLTDSENIFFSGHEENKTPFPRVHDLFNPARNLLQEKASECLDAYWPVKDCKCGLAGCRAVRSSEWRPFVDPVFEKECSDINVKSNRRVNAVMSKSLEAYWPMEDGYHLFDGSAKEEVKHPEEANRDSLPMKEISPECYEEERKRFRESDVGKITVKHFRDIGFAEKHLDHYNPDCPLVGIPMMHPTCTDTDSFQKHGLRRWKKEFVEDFVDRNYILEDIRNLFEPPLEFRRNQSRDEVKNGESCRFFTDHEKRRFKEAHDFIMKNSQQLRPGIPDMKHARVVIPYPANEKKSSAAPEKPFYREGLNLTEAEKKSAEKFDAEIELKTCAIIAKKQLQIAEEEQRIRHVQSTTQKWVTMTHSAPVIAVEGKSEVQRLPEEDLNLNGHQKFLLETAKMGITWDEGPIILDPVLAQEHYDREAATPFGKLLQETKEKALKELVEKEKEKKDLQALQRMREWVELSSKGDGKCRYSDPVGLKLTPFAQSSRKEEPDRPVILEDGVPLAMHEFKVKIPPSDQLLPLMVDHERPATLDDVSKSAEDVACRSPGCSSWEHNRTWHGNGWYMAACPFVRIPGRHIDEDVMTMPRPVSWESKVIEKKKEIWLERFEDSLENDSERRTLVAPKVRDDFNRKRKKTAHQKKTKKHKNPTIYSSNYKSFKHKGTDATF